MGFSEEWENTYRTGTHNSIWPWSEVVSLVNHYFKGQENLRVLELGCGAGANIPFFDSIGASYYGIEGSQTQVDLLNERFDSDKITIAQGDFTKDLLFDQRFDLVLDRSSVTHNKTEDIRNVVRMVNEKLVGGGCFFGIDWFSSGHSHHDTDDDEYEWVDDNTRIFTSGYFSGLGNVHFSDADHILGLFKDMDIVELYEKTKQWSRPTEKVYSHWSFVAKKRG